MEGKIKMTIGRYHCRASYKTIGLTDTMEKIKKHLSKEGNENGTGLRNCNGMDGRTD